MGQFSITEHNQSRLLEFVSTIQSDLSRQTIDKFRLWIENNAGEAMTPLNLVHSNQSQHKNELVTIIASKVLENHFYVMSLPLELVVGELEMIKISLCFALFLTALIRPILDRFDFPGTG